MFLKTGWTSSWDEGHKNVYTVFWDLPFGTPCNKRCCNLGREEMPYEAHRRKALGQRRPLARYGYKYFIDNVAFLKVVGSILISISANEFYN
jgi:hypothetical protein